MGKIYSELDQSLSAWIRKQHVFFVGTAPTEEHGHLNISPKGQDTFRILDEKTVAFLDLTGSGIETVAHLRQNGRMTIMFCAFEGPPRILRLYGMGEILLSTSPEFSQLLPLFPQVPGARSIIRLRLNRIADSCGFGVPLMRYEADRDQLVASAERKGPDGIKEYQAKRNGTSIDGLPGLPNRLTWSDGPVRA